jgi:uncharacterized protein (TIGR02678 family)
LSEPRLVDHLASIAGEEIRRATRSLLRRPLITAEGPQAEELILVRRHRDALAGWFQSELGYRLVVENDFARLHKTPGPQPVPRQLETRNRVPFDSRRYALFCLVLAALEQEEEQTTLERLAEAVRLQAQDIDGFEVDFDAGTERRAFVHAVQAAQDLGAIRLRDGDEERFVRNEGGGNALYQIRHRRLAQLLSSPEPPSAVDDPGALQNEPYPDTQDGRSRRSRHRVMRAIVEEPVCYFEDLEESDRAYLTSQRGRLFSQLRERCGLEPELRAEGIAAIDPLGEMTDQSFPSEGTVAHAALLLADELARRGRSARGESMTHAETVRFMSSLAATHARLWRADLAGSPEGHARLAELAIERLESFGLLRRVAGGVEPRPAVARFAPAPLASSGENGSESAP